MTQSEFDRALALTRMRTGDRSMEAAAAVLVHGLTQVDAAAVAGLHQGTVSAACARIRAAAALTICPKCGQTIP